VTLAPLRMSVPASDGLILKGELTYPAGATGRSYPLAVLAHQYPATHDSFSPLIADLLAVATVGVAGALAFGPDGPARIRTAIEGAAGIRFLLASSQADALEGAANAEAWSGGLGHACARVVPGSGHAMAIYFAVRDELVGFLRDALGA